MDIRLQEINNDPPLPLLVNQISPVQNGRALDLAMGDGRNAIYLAQQGYRVDGVDLSEPAVKKAAASARALGLSINGIVADLEKYTIRPDRYDLICCFFYLARPLFPAIRRALRPGGKLIYQSVTIDECRYKPNFPKAWCLERNELLHAFQDLRVLYYEESATPALISKGMTHTALASLVAVREEGTTAPPSRANGP
jgi:SAM-dependent methyltransferase